MKKRTYMIGTVFILCVATCFLTAFQSKPVITVNGHKIYEDEYSLLSHVFTGGVQAGEQRPEDRVTFAKVEQQMLKENAVIEDISYSAFCKTVEKENEARKKAIVAGEKIYGPKEYDTRIYYDYIYSEAKERMIKDVLMGRISEDEVIRVTETNGSELKEEEDKQYIRYQIAKECYMAELKERVSKAVVKE
ncbi:hypothetical protein [Lacrimispora algidixylanolytica]|uniref:Trigger factor C-terminal domain-containing protein n=1 Tax=Lacrimispora algidixylanolytica TaxID=94868 RepID=A0A419T1Z0_9FIRM|nr:hypothetical protein [Lacrimispora algidixylanolytica]RKD31580.1 hypothetical protein BET01_19815 [Lacrimispora algidixylanolytica]